MNPDSNGWVGLANYSWMARDPGVRVIMVNTILWIIVVPLFTAALALLLAVMQSRYPVLHAPPAPMSPELVVSINSNCIKVSIHLCCNLLGLVGF
jgi:hypothetical protein